MAEAILPPPPPNPHDTGPAQGSAAWILIQENNTKRKNFGAGLGFVSDEKIRHFELEMSFATKADTSSSINLYTPHKAFITKLLEVTEGDAHVMPTKKNTLTDATISTKSPIISSDAFPTSTYLHSQFFESKIYVNERTKRTVVKIKHQVLMKEPIHVVKTKMMDFLRANGLWIRGGDLDAVETSGFGWFFAAHDSMVFRPALKNKLVELIASLPPAIVDKAIKDFGAPTDAGNLPEIFLNSKWQQFGNHPKRVQTHAVTISCVNNKIRLMKELICSIPKASMPFQFVHIGLATTNHPDLYWKSIVANNDSQNELQGIAVKGFSKELLSKQMETTYNIVETVESHFLNFRSIVSIEETHKTHECGRYIFVVYKKDFPAAQAHIASFCDNKFCRIYTTQEEQDVYRTTYQHHPHLVASPTAGGAVGANGDYLVEMLAKVEIARGQPFSLATGSYASKTAPRIIIEQGPSEQFPPIPGSRPVPILDTHSTTSSDSTIAATKTGATVSGHTFASQDVSVAISEMKSMMTSWCDSQNKFLQQNMEAAKAEAKLAKQEAKEEAAAARREAREDAKAAAEAARKDAAIAARQTQELLVNMVRMMMGEPPAEAKRKRDSTRSLTRAEQSKRDFVDDYPNDNQDETMLDTPFNELPDYTFTGSDNDEASTVEFIPDAELEQSDDTALFSESDNDRIIHNSQRKPSEKNTGPPTKKKHNTRPSPARHSGSHMSFLLPRAGRGGGSPTPSLLQRTGTAPPKPSQLDRTARSLDFGGQKESTKETPAAPNPNDTSPNQQ
jgi:hypothetical protein